jgi:hypothetical protein
MFTDMHLLDATRLTTLDHPLAYIFLVIPFLYALTVAPAPCSFRPLNGPSASKQGPAPSTNPGFDQRLLLGILTGTFVLLQSNVANMVAYLSAGLFYSAVFHRAL